MAYLPKKHVDRPALVVELRWDQSGPGAIWQIWNKKYAACIAFWNGIQGDGAAAGRSCGSLFAVYADFLKIYDSVLTFPEFVVI